MQGKTLPTLKTPDERTAANDAKSPPKEPLGTHPPPLIRKEGAKPSP
jgi:hypothetical protein